MHASIVPRPYTTGSHPLTHIYSVQTTIALQERQRPKREKKIPILCFFFCTYSRIGAGHPSSTLGIQPWFVPCEYRWSIHRYWWFDPSLSQRIGILNRAELGAGAHIVRSFWPELMHDWFRTDDRRSWLLGGALWKLAAYSDGDACAKASATTVDPGLPV